MLFNMDANVFAGAVKSSHYGDRFSVDGLYVLYEILEGFRGVIDYDPATFAGDFCEYDTVEEALSEFGLIDYFDPEDYDPNDEGFILDSIEDLNRRTTAIRVGYSGVLVVNT